MAGKKRRENRARITDPTPAPGALELVRAFVSTAGSDRAPEEWGSPRKLARWLAGQRLLDPDAELTKAEWNKTRAVRQALRAVLAAHNGAAADPEATDRLEQAVRGARLRLRFDGEGPEGFEPGSATLDDALAAVLAVVAQARHGKHWQYLKVCARPGCHRAFYDASANRSGRYCTRRCTDRLRASAYRKTERYKSLRGRRRG